MEKTGDLKQDARRFLNKTRMVGKLLGREKKISGNKASDEDISDFLGGPSEKLNMEDELSMALPESRRLDMSNSQHRPTSIEARHLTDNPQGYSIRPKRTRKGLIVRFSDQKPEIIGHGGDETEDPPSRIGLSRRRAHSHPNMILQGAQSNGFHTSEIREDDTCSGRKSESDIFQPQRIRRTQTGHVPTLETTKHTTGVPHMSDAPEHGLTQREIVPSGNSLIDAPKSSLGKAMAESLSAPKHAANIETTVLPHVDIVSCDDALDVFCTRMQHLFKLFILSAESNMPLSKTSTEDLMRAASWWFLKGRAQLEQAVQGHPLSADNQRLMANLRQQAHIDLAKSLWIISDILPVRFEKIRSTASVVDGSEGSEHTVEGRHSLDLAWEVHTIRNSLSKLTLSMMRHGMLPTSVNDAPLSSNMDLGIWVAHPSSIPEISGLLSGLSSLLISPTSGSRETMPIGDTARCFVYGRIFVELYLTGGGVELQQFRCPCILSICRKRTEKNIMFNLASQNGLIAISIQSDTSTSPNWHDVQWDGPASSLKISLSTSLKAYIQLSPSDYKILWNMYDFTSRTHAALRPQKDEIVMFEDIVKSVQYSAHVNRSPVSRESFAVCHVRVFEKVFIESVGGSTDIKCCGFRIAATTNESTKNLGGLNHDLSTQEPIGYKFIGMEENVQGIVLSFDDGTQQKALVLGFEDVQRRAKLHDCLVGWPRSAETVVARIALENIHVQDAIEPNNILRFPSSTLSRSQDIWIVREHSTDGLEIGKARTSHSQGLRLFLTLGEVFINDRVRIEPGDLRLCLPVKPDTYTLAILRKSQLDMTLSFADSDRMAETNQGLRKILHTIAKNETIRTYCFSNLNDMHIFQTAISGFDIIFDGMASSFAISRRRMVVPIHKKWEASTSRLQVLRQGKSYQLAAFFDGFSHGDCMNFALKATDTFESFNKDGMYQIRLVDAKFPLPRGGTDDDHRPQSFICLDEPDFPSEHDDITISFTSEAGMSLALTMTPRPISANHYRTRPLC